MMKKKYPKVSVIIPTYKRDSKYLSRAIKSIKRQTYKNIEIIIVDDNLKDSKHRRLTMNFMNQYSNDSNILYHLNEENIGGALARNVGINLSKGEYITFLDDDDEYLPNKIKKQIEFMQTEKYDMSFTNLILVNSNGFVVDYREYSNLNGFNKEVLIKYHLMKHLTGTPTFMFSSEKLREIGGFDNVKMGQEFYLMLKSIEKGLNIGYLNECDVKAYRHNEGGISQGKNKIKGEKELYNFKKKYFEIFNFREKMFIRFRHFAVMAVAYKRDNQYLKSLLSVMLMFVFSPIDFLKEGIKFITSIYSKRKQEVNSNGTI